MTAYALALPVRAVAGYTVALNVFGFFAVAMLSGSLADRLRSAGAQLEQASTEIADLQALNQHVIDSLPSGLATTDSQQRVLTFNRAAESITGMRCDSAIGRTIDEVLQLPPPMIDSIQSDLRDRGTRRHEYRYRPADGRGELEIGLTATYLETPRGRAGLLFTFQDVTNIKKLERDAAIQQRLAAVGEMAAGIAHEIRNPLASMSGSIPDSAAGASAQRGAGAADGHRAPRIGAPQHDDRFVSRVPRGRSASRSSASTSGAR